MDYHNQPPCHTPDGFLVQQFAYDPTSPLYKTYAEHLGKMKTNATAGQEKLVGILKQLFIKTLEKGPTRSTRRRGRTAARYRAHQAAYAPHHQAAYAPHHQAAYAAHDPRRAWRGGAAPREAQHVIYTLNPTLTHQKLDSIVLQTRKLILELYTQCEIDFKTGIKLFEAIVEKKEQEKMAKQHAVLKEQMGKLIQ
jgi:hypothetical protein